MQGLISTLLCAILVGGWTFIWLTWLFKGDVRAWLAALLFPSKWRAGHSRAAIASLSPSQFTKWLAMSSDAPPFACNLLHCHYCCSAHVAAAGAIVLALTGWLPLPGLPFVWVVGAAIGIILYETTYRSKTDTD